MNSSLLILAAIQVVFAGIVSVYFFNLMRTQQHNRVNIDRESSREMERLRRLRAISLTEPLSEKTRPASMRDIVGQEDGLRALRAALFGPHPQHVLIYGPPGVGKTAAARVVLEEAKCSTGSPFATEAVFWEIDATTARFDERGIADPLIGSVHDPIYQGAGSMGVAGIPQPKPGAVTKAHGGVLFIDEIGELHSIQMNKLLKVLEDRRVYLESAYYNPDDVNIPLHIHDIFQQGLPADFRLVGATTRSPEEIPPAIRSRCVEVFFRPLVPIEIGIIVERAAAKLNMPITDEAVSVVKRHATNGREAVNVVQIAAGITLTDGRTQISSGDMEWVVHSSHIAMRPERKVPLIPQVGVVNGLAVYGPSLGLLLEVEATATQAAVLGHGSVSVTGVVEEEEIGGSGRVLKRRSMARTSVDNVLTALRRILPVNISDYEVHVNFPGGIPVDGPSAGVSMAVAIYSAVTGLKVDNLVAMTGEVSIYGGIRPVGGVSEKVVAAREAGATKVLIPVENDQARLHQDVGIEVVPIIRLEEALAIALGVSTLPEPLGMSALAPILAPGAAVQGTI